MIGRLALAAALTAGMLLAGTAADARVRHPHAVAASDMDRTLAHMAERDGLGLWPRWQERRALANRLPPLTRERIAAPPLTGWGYAGTVTGVWSGF